MVESNTTDSKTINYEYDKTGNIIKDDKHTYTYDSRNRLTAIDDNVTYQYNYDNRRVSKTVNGVKTYFIYDGHMLIGEYQLNLSDHSRQEYVYLNSTPIATMTANEMGRVYADHLDTSRRVATNDSNAQIVWKWESKPFGETKASGDITFNLRFPGQYFDVETSTHYNINRDYNPVTGRYIQSDPIGFDGGVNSYLYVASTPLVFMDKEGLKKSILGIFWDLFFGKKSKGKKCTPPANTVCYFYDAVPPSKPHHPFLGSHYHLFKHSQAPNGKCFWNKYKVVESKPWFSIPCSFKRSGGR